MQTKLNSGTEGNINAFKNVYYDLWGGPAPFRPYSPLWVPWNWRGWMPFGGGAIGDRICHVVDPSFWTLDLDAPASVQTEVTDYDPVKQALTYPSATRIAFEFPAKKTRGPVKFPRDTKSCWIFPSYYHY